MVMLPWFINSKKTEMMISIMGFLISKIDGLFNTRLLNSWTGVTKPIFNDY